jgi:putative tricarboxylic transport membrane protein
MIATATDGLAPYFLTGALNLFLIVVVVLSVLYSGYMELRTRRYTSKEEIMG